MRRIFLWATAFAVLLFVEVHGPSILHAQTAARANSPAEQFARGDAALRAGDLDTAEKAFRKVVALDPNAAGAYANLGVIAMRRKQWDEALTMLKKAERLAPAEPGFRLNIGLVYFRQNHFAAAIPPLVSVVKERPELEQARYLLGLCYFFTDD